MVTDAPTQRQTKTLVISAVAAQDFFCGDEVVCYLGRDGLAHAWYPSDGEKPVGVVTSDAYRGEPVTVLVAEYEERAK